MMENSKPEPQHLWLYKLLGDWVSEGSMPNEDGSVTPWTAEERFRKIGDVWVQGEGRSTTPDGKIAHTQMTLGYDPAKGHFVGSWLGTMMTHLWIYKGTLDEAGKVLTLESEGPSFSGDGSLEMYRDVIEFKNDDERTLTAYNQGKDGAWTSFMSVVYRRKAG